MKGFHIVVLLSSAVLLVSAAPALQLVTCTAESGAAAARLAMHRINENHRHGYKFRLQEIQGNKVEKENDGCNLELQLNLQETVCHVVNPKHFEECQTREVGDRAVMANCTVKMSVRNNDANVTKYECDTRQVKTNQEMVSICPDCPILDSLNSTKGLKSVNEAVSKFNQNATNQHHYILTDVGRIKDGYMYTVGMAYHAQFALVETHCPMGSRINPEACKPLCPDRAEMVSICPDCPILDSLNSTKGLKSVNEAVSKFNQNATNQHHYILTDVGRIKDGYMYTVGMAYHAQFALVETHCPMGSRINPEACKPLCPDRAHHAFCKSTYFRETVQSLDCEFYPPSNTTALGPGEQEPVCRHHVGGHPPHVGGGRPPLGCILPHLGGDGDPPHVGHGPPPHGGDGHPSRPCGPPHHGDDGHPPHVGGGHAGDGHPDQEKQHHRPPFGSKHQFHAFHHCRGSDPALHPICPWPRTWRRPSPRGED